MGDCTSNQRPSVEPWLLGPMAMQRRLLSRRPPRLMLRLMQRLFHCRRMQVIHGSKRVVILGGPLERGKMASNLIAMASNLIAMASNLLAVASNQVAMPHPNNPGAGHAPVPGPEGLRWLGTLAPPAPPPTEVAYGVSCV